MRKIAIVLAILALGCATVSAAPLANYDFGHAAFNLGLTLPTTSGQPNPDPANGSYFGTTAGLEYGVEVGLGAGLALRVDHNEIYGPLGSGIRDYEGNNGVTAYYTSSQNNYDVMMGGQVMNEQNFGSIYLGMQSYSTGLTLRDGDGNKQVGGMQAYGFHGGIQGVSQLADQHTVYYNVSYGTLDFDAKLGYAYSLTPNVDMNLSLEYNNLRLNQLGYNAPNTPEINGENTVQSWIPALSVTAKF